MKITIVGTGYVGLVTGTCFASVGIETTCVDVDERKIENLKKGIIPIYEPGLEDLVVKNYKESRLHFSTKLSECLDGTEVVFIAVGTPPDEDGSADLKYVLQVAREVGKNMTGYTIVVTKSTVPVGTANKVRAAIEGELKARNADIPFNVASNPEFLKEGNAVQDFLKPDRIVVGVENEKSEEILAKLYKPFTLNGHPIIFMDIASSEMTKYTANSMLATKISFMNDIANLCELVGADIHKVRKGIGSDPRIGNKFIYAGAGYGGSCFPKDVQALVRTAREYGHELRILQSVEDVNNDQKYVLFNKAFKHFEGDMKGKVIGIWGLSFKPQTDDMREAPALTIINQLLKQGATVKVFDPVAMEEAEHKLGDSVTYCKEPYEAVMDADALMLVTEWSEFRYPNFQVMKRLMKGYVIFDGRNIYDPKDVQNEGFTYYGIGRKIN